VHVVFLIHGMGKHPAGWSEPITTFLKERYAIGAGKPLREEVAQFVEITYDDVFSGWLNRWAKAGNDLAAFPEVASVAGFLDELNHDDPLYTHLADVVLFTLFPQISREVITSVRTQMLSAFAGNRTAQFSILAHSLGTSVAQRTVATLDDEALGGSYPPSLLSFANLIMVANVSRVLTLPHHDSLYDTLVRPSVGSYCANYWSIRHALDVLTRPWPFHPPPAGWAMEPATYRDTEVKHYDQDPNVHDLLNHLKNPRVHLPLLARIAGLRMPAPDLEATIATYEQGHQLDDLVRGQLEPYLKKASDLERGELKDVLDLMKSFLGACGVKP